jgi:glycosyltransferase involved in cell wall biosynthesis
MASTGDAILFVLCLGVVFLALAVGVRLVIAARRIRWHAVPLADGKRTSKVTVIVPARNEEQDLAAALESILQQTDVTLEVIVVDDHSTDRTGMIAAAAARADPRVQVIHQPLLPPGWLGKSNAMHQAAARASGAYLLFTDADILYQPPCLALALAEMEQHHLDLLSLLPLMRCGSLWENVLAPGFAWGIMVRFARPGLWDGTGPDAYAVGAFMLVRRDAFEAIGGFEAIKADTCDDIALARQLKKHGYRIGLQAATHLLQVRLFKSAADAFWGPTKNVLSGLHGHIWLAPFVLLWPLVVFWTPVVAIVVGAWESHAAVLLAGCAAYVALYASLWPSRSLFRFHPLKALFFPLLVISFWCCLLGALYHYLAWGSIVWRGRAVKVR